MIQQILVVLIFGAAVAYVANFLIKNFKAEKSCASGCGKCGAVDFEKISKQMKQDGF